MSETKFTAGPWRWELNPRGKRLYLLGGVPQYDLTVMDFARWGMDGATMRLRDTAHDGFNVMYRVHERDDWHGPQKGRDHHSDWHQLVTHPDAALIAAAPDLYAAAEFDSRLDALTAFDNEAYGNMETWDGYFEEKWAKAEELFPDVAAQYPMPTDDEVQEWSGSDDSAIGVRESKYGEDFIEVLYSMKRAMRDAALAKARGEA